MPNRDAADASRLRIDWKVTCGLAQDDEGFHPTTLTYWCNRMRKSLSRGGSSMRLPQRPRHRRRVEGPSSSALESTVIDDAVATHDTVTTASSGFARRTSSTSMAMRFRNIIDVDRIMVSPMDMVGNSRGNAPVSPPPRATKDTIAEVRTC